MPRVQNFKVKGRGKIYAEFICTHLTFRGMKNVCVTQNFEFNTKNLCLMKFTLFVSSLVNPWATNVVYIWSS